MDLSQAIVPKSDQLNADDLMGSPHTFTITSVSEGNSEQPVNVGLSDARPFRPSKSMLRVMVAAWGLDGKEWVGHRVTLYRDPHVRFGGMEVGGIRISHMTGIDKPLKLALTETRGKRGMFTVQPLREAPPTASEQTRSALLAAFAEAGINGRDASRAAVTEALGRNVEWVNLTEQDALTVIAHVQQRPDAATDTDPAHTVGDQDGAA